MAFTAADLDAIDAALVVAATEGIASATIAGQTVVNRSVADLTKLREVVANNLPADAGTNSLGMRFRQMVPGECG